MITKKAEYAIHILSELSNREKDRYHSSREVATRHNTPANLVPQLVSLLQKGGLIESARGPTGGIRLVGDPEKISLRQVIELVDGPMALTRCLTSEDYCPKSKRCPLHRIWRNTQHKMISELENTSVKDLAEAHTAAESLQTP